jgi:hypothetical protein
MCEEVVGACFKVPLWHSTVGMNGKYHIVNIVLPLICIAAHFLDEPQVS